MRERERERDMGEGRVIERERQGERKNNLEIFQSQIHNLTPSLQTFLSKNRKPEMTMSEI